MRTNGTPTSSTRFPTVGWWCLAAEITIFVLLGRHHYWLAFVLAMIPGAAGFAAVQEWRWQLRVAALRAESRKYAISFDDFDKATKYCLLARPFFLEERAQPAPGVYGTPPAYLWDEPVSVQLVEQLSARIQVVGLQNGRAVRRFSGVKIVTVEDAQWEIAFEALARQAVVIVVDSDSDPVSPGVKRELEILDAIGARSKTALISNSSQDTLPQQVSGHPSEDVRWHVSVVETDGARTNQTIGDILRFIDSA